MQPEQRAMLVQRLQTLLRTNTYDGSTGRLTLDPIRGRAFEDNLKHYTEIFTNGSLDYAIQQDAQSDPAKLRQLTAFYFWTAWASAAGLAQIRKRWRRKEQELRFASTR